jgi:hypothetical protein
MLPTVETRWFMAGPLPQDTLQWFQRGAPAPSLKPAPRTDRYLLVPGVTGLGVKLREGRFEVKRRDADFGLTALASRTTGRLAVWRKWSFQVSSDVVTVDEDWISISKERYLRKFTVQGSASIAEVDPSTYPECGCSVELTRLRAGHDDREADWWSVGLEALGPDPSQLRTELRVVAAHFFEREDCPSLRVEDSLDYPEWLTSFATESRPVTRRSAPPAAR